MTRRSIKWRHSREDDPDFKASFEKVIMEISLSSDDNCLGQSRNVEKQYFINHKESVRQNVLMIQKGLRILPKGKESAILDIGTSPMTFVYRKCFPNVRMFTIDLTSLLADRCHKNRIEHCVCDLLKDEIPFSPGQMDMVVFTEVFEHLNTGPGKAFSEIKKFLEREGFWSFLFQISRCSANASKRLWGRRCSIRCIECTKRKSRRLHMGTESGSTVSVMCGSTRWPRQSILSITMDLMF